MTSTPPPADPASTDPPRRSVDSPRQGLGKLPVPKNNEKSDKAQAILAGALQVFTAHGYAAASMDRIASAAGVSKPTLYTYFQNKEGLFVALIQHLLQNSDRAFHRSLTDAYYQLPPEQVLRQIASSLLTKASGNRPFLTLMRLIISESEQFPELAQTFIKEISKPLLERLSSYFTNHPQLEFADPEVAARVFSGSIVHYLITQEIMHGKKTMPLDRERMIDGLIQLILKAGQPL